MSKSIFFAAKQMTWSGHSLKAALTHLLAKHDAAVRRRKTKGATADDDADVMYDGVAEARVFLTAKAYEAMPQPTLPQFKKQARLDAMAKALSKAGAK